MPIMLLAPADIEHFNGLAIIPRSATAREDRASLRRCPTIYEICARSLLNKGSPLRPVERRRAIGAVLRFARWAPHHLRGKAPERPLGQSSRALGGLDFFQLSHSARR
jgi:hypothetical protein